MKHYNYKTNESKVADECENTRTTYGISLYIADADAPIRVINDIFPSKEQADAFSKMCTELQLSPDHIDDVIDDWFAWVSTT